MPTRTAQVRRRAGRPSAAVLDRERIVAAALAMLDDVVVEEFSLDGLARRMSVRPSSFYNHTSGKDDILAGVQELVIDSIDAAMFEELPWREAVELWARSYRAAFVAHPNTIILFALAPVLGAIRALHMYERVACGFERAGWPQDEIIPSLTAIESFLLGSALGSKAAPGQFAAGKDAVAVPRFAAGVRAADRSARRRRRATSDRSFEIGLAAMLDGMAAQLAVHIETPTRKGNRDERRSALRRDRSGGVTSLAPSNVALDNAMLDNAFAPSAVADSKE